MEYLSEKFSLEGKTVAVTGGGGTIAKALAEAYIQAGANITLWGHRAQSIEETKRFLSDKLSCEDRVQVVVCDTSQEEDVRKAVDACCEIFGGIDVLVNAAGGNRGKAPLVDLDIKVFQEVVNLNLIAGLVVPTKVVAAYWIAEERPGCIINMASMSSYIPLSGVWAYNASKSAVKNLTMACAKEFAHAGIRVNAIAPGFFIGKQNRDLLIDRETKEFTPRGMDVLRHTPMGRFGDVQELAGVALLLASEKAAGFITGVTIPVDGGYLVDNI